MPSEMDIHTNIIGTSTTVASVSLDTGMILLSPDSSICENRLIQYYREVLSQYGNKPQMQEFREFFGLGKL